MVEHVQSGDQTMAPEDSAWQAMPHFGEIGCTFFARREILLKINAKILLKINVKIFKGKPISTRDLF